MKRRRTLSLLCLTLLSALAAASADDMLKLSEERQKIVDRYVEILLEDPRNEFAFQQFYNAYKAEDKEFQLVDFFRNAIRLEPNKANLHVILGRLYVQFRDLYQAGVKFKDAARIDPKDHYARYLLADVFFKQRDYENAAEEYRIAGALASDMNDRVRSLFGLARVFAVTKQWGRAGNTWEDIARLRPYDPDALRQLAQASRDFEQWELAEKWLTQLQELVNEDAEAACFVLVDLAEITAQRGQYDEAVELYRNARAYLSESHWRTEEINKRIRDCYEREKQTNELRKILEEHAASRPRDLDARLELAGFFRAENNPEEARKQLDLASQISPRDVQILEQYRAVLVQLDDSAGVEEADKRLLALSPRNVHYRLQMAEFQIARGHKDKAREIWNAIVDEDKTQPARYLAVARAMKRAGEFDWAEEVYEKLHHLAPENANFAIESAELYFLLAKNLPPPGTDNETWQKRTEEYSNNAETLILEAAKKGSMSLAETQQAGRLLLDNRVLEPAREVLKTGREHFPEHMGLSRLLGETCLLLGGRSRGNTRSEFYGEAITNYLAAFDLAPHPALKQEMNSELTALELGYGGGQNGIRNLLAKHLADSVKHPKDPIPMWCIADIQQQLPVMTFPGITYNGAPAGGMPIVTGDPGAFGLQFFNMALERNPLFIPAYLGKSAAYCLRDSFEQGVVELRKAAVIDPVNKWKYFMQIGDLFANQGQMQEAEAFWNRVSERVFTDATVFYQLGCRYFSSDKVKEAMDLLRKAIAANPGIYSYHLTLGNMYDSLHDYPNAVACYRKALELCSHGMLLPLRQRLNELQKNWAYELFDGGKYEQALQQFKEIHQFHEVLKKYYQAKKDERTLKRFYPETADIQVQIARCEEALGRHSEADAAFKSISPEEYPILVRMSPFRKMAAGYLLSLRDRKLGPKSDNLKNAGTVSPRPFKLELVRHVKLYDIAREHSITPNGVLYAGTTKWVEVDPLSGNVLRTMPPDKYIRYQDGVEIRVLRIPNAPGSDQIQIVRNGKTITAEGAYHPRLADMEITPARVFFVNGAAGGKKEIVALDVDSGKVAWRVAAHEHNQDIVFGGNYLACLASWEDQTTLIIRNAPDGKAILTQKLPLGGIWLQPVTWGNKVFLVDDVAWKLYMADIATGNFDYCLAFDGAFPRPPVIHDNVLYIHSRAYEERTIYLYAIDPAAGRILWKTDLKAMSVHSPPIFSGDDIVYLDPEKQAVFMIDRKTGARHAEASYKDDLTLRERVYIRFMQPFKDHLLLVGSEGHIHAFKVLKK